MGQKIVQVDAFAERPFAGNPAAVCVMEGPREEEWMQAVAREMNLSETAFLYPADGGYNLRWFTPAVEIELCGHATLASAHVLWEEGHVERSHPIKFHTRSGVLLVTAEEELILMDFPSTDSVPAPAPEGMLAALGVEASYIARAGKNYLVEVADEKAVRGCSPDFGGLLAAGAGRVIVTAGSDDDQFDFVSRFFAPGAGVNEDPVTGAAHCALGPYWAGKLGREEVTGYQASMRGGVVRVTVRGERVLLAGQAVTVLRGELVVG